MLDMSFGGQQFAPATGPVPFHRLLHMQPINGAFFFLGCKGSSRRILRDLVHAALVWPIDHNIFIHLTTPLCSSSSSSPTNTHLTNDLVLLARKCCGSSAS